MIFHLPVYKIVQICIQVCYKATFEFGQIDQQINDNGEVIDTGVLGFGITCSILVAMSCISEICFKRYDHKKSVEMY